MDTHVVTVVEIDQDQVDDFGGGALLATLEGAVGAGNRPAIVDMSRVSRIGSAGLRALVAAAKRNGAFFGVVAPEPPLRELLAIGRVDAIVPVFASLDDARSAATRA